MKKGKRICLVSILTMIMLVASQSIIYAGTTEKDAGISQKKEIDNTEKSVGSTRGSLISSFEVSITDRGNGTAGLFGSVLCHEPMKEIRMNLYLDIWDSNESDWITIESYQFAWNESNTALDDRDVGVVSFNVRGLERGRDYQVRGLAGATSYAGGHESWNAESGYIQVQSVDNLVTE